MIHRLAAIIKKEGLLNVNIKAKTLTAGGSSLARQLIAQHLVTPDYLAQIIAKRTGYRHVKSLERLKIDDEMFDRLPMGIFRWWDAFPVSMADELVQVALVDPTDQLAIQQLRFFTSCRIKPMVASLDLIDLLFEKFQPGVKLSSTPPLPKNLSHTPRVAAKVEDQSPMVRHSVPIVTPKKPKVAKELLPQTVPSLPPVQTSEPIAPVESKQNFDPLPLDFKSLQEVDDESSISHVRPAARTHVSYESLHDPDSLVLPSSDLKDAETHGDSNREESVPKVQQDPGPTFEAVDVRSELSDDPLLELSLANEDLVDHSARDSESDLIGFNSSTVPAVDESQNVAVIAEIPEPSTGLHPGVGHLNQLLVKVSLQSSPQKIFEVISDSCVKIGIQSGVLFTLQIMESGATHSWTLDATGQRVTQDELPRCLEEIGIKSIMELLHAEGDADWTNLEVKLGSRWQIFADAWDNVNLPPTHMFSAPTKTGQKLVAMLRFSGLAYHRNLMMTVVEVLKATAKRL